MKTPHTPTELHAAIMNLPCSPDDCGVVGIGAELAYKQGHRNARHAAAELALAAAPEAGEPADPIPVERIPALLRRWAEHPDLGSAFVPQLMFAAADALAATQAAPAVTVQAGEPLSDEAILALAVQHGVVFELAEGCYPGPKVEDADMSAEVIAFARALAATPAAETSAQASAWQPLTEGEREQAVSAICEYGTGFVAPLFAVIEGVERKLMERNTRAQASSAAGVQELKDALLIEQNLVKVYRAEIARLADQAPEIPATVPALSRAAVATAYGYLWHVNNEPGTPAPMYSPERAAYEARRLLRDQLTKAERGEAINAVRAAIAAAPASTSTSTPAMGSGTGEGASHG